MRWRWWWCWWWQLESFHWGRTQQTIEINTAPRNVHRMPSMAWENEPVFILWTLTSTFDLCLRNWWHDKYSYCIVSQRSFFSIVTVWRDRQTDTYGPVALPAPLKWSVIILSSGLVSISKAVRYLILSQHLSPWLYLMLKQSGLTSHKGPIKVRSHDRSGSELNC